jgi:poly(3-hydroxybutyrate) depolymerase
MHRYSILTLALGLLFTRFALAQQANRQEQLRPGDKQEPFAVRTFKRADNAELTYSWLAPAELKAGEKYPLVLCLHGAGGGTTAAAVLAKDDMRKGYPCFILAPKAGENAGWASTPAFGRKQRARESLPLAVEAIRSLLKSEAIDPDRIYVTGQSMGGVGSWGAIARYPELFAAAAPVCGAWDVNDAAKMIAVPIWAFHGESDTTVPTRFSRELTAAVTKAGGQAKYTEYKGVGHGSWGPAYADAELWKWMFAQRKGKLDEEDEDEEKSTETSFRFVPDAEGISILEGDAKVLRYQRATKSQEGKYPRANCVHPLYDLAGNELTEDFPADHLHHRGIFWAWHQVKIGDMQISDNWAVKDALWDVTDVETRAEADHATLVATVHWKSPKWLDAQGEPKPFVREETTIRAQRANLDNRAIDFEIRLLALEPNLSIGGSQDEKGYGGFSPRVRLPKDIEFLGEKGPVEPQLGAVEAGPWVDITGTYGADKPSGLAVLCHPSLPVFPPPWVLRRKGSMQNAVYPGAKPVPLSNEKLLTLRYRLVVHTGRATIDQVNGWQKEYAAVKVP